MRIGNLFNPNGRFLKFFCNYGWDLLLGSIAFFYLIMVPYTKVEESFNVQAMHDILYHGKHIDRYDHIEFPGVVPRTFIGAIIVSIFASPLIASIQLFNASKIYSLLTVRFALGCIVLLALRFFRIQVRRKFGYNVEAFFAMLTTVQFHLLFYATRPLPNILAFILVNFAYGFWFGGNAASTLKCLGGDVGTQYRSGIYYYSPEQEKSARATLKAHQKALGREIVTEILPAKKFYIAEEYHQQYLEKGGRGGAKQSASKGCDDPIRCYG